MKAAKPLLLHKVEASDFSADGVRADETLTLATAATAKLKALAADKQMERLWQTISPVKKAAATGSDGSSQPPITDAMRAAVAHTKGRNVNRIAVAYSGNLCRPARYI